MTESTTKKVKEPLFHITKRASMPFWKAAGIRVLSVLAAVIICSVMSTILIGRNPFAIFGSFVKGLFIDPWTLLQDTALLLAFGLAIVPAFRMKYWNMGANGQVLMGCLAAIYCMINVPDEVPGGVVIIIMLLAAIAVSVLWAAIPAIFKALFNTNETLFTLMMNYIAAGLVNHFCYKQTKYQKINIGIVNLMSKRAWLPQLGNKYLLPILIVALMTAFVFVYMKYSKHGYEIEVVGESANTAKYVGIKRKKSNHPYAGVIGRHLRRYRLFVRRRYFPHGIGKNGYARFHRHSYRVARQIQSADYDRHGAVRGGHADGHGADQYGFLSRQHRFFQYDYRYRVLLRHRLRIFHHLFHQSGGRLERIYRESGKNFQTQKNG